MNKGIYKITCEAEGPEQDRVYIGSSVQIEKRWGLHRNHLNKGTHHAPQLQAAWMIYGPDAFRFEIIEHVAEDEKLREREQFWLDELGAVAFGYNVCPLAGTVKGIRKSAEAKAKIGAANKGKIVSAETRAKLSFLSLKENLPPEQRAKQLAGARAYNSSDAGRAEASRRRKGKPHDAASKAKISAGGKGRVFSEEHKAKIGEANRRRVVTDETKAKISAAKHNLSEEARENIKRGQRRRRENERTAS